MRADPRLYLVPTPIGNLGDITLRSIEVLKSVDLVLAEDTRNSGNLLKQYEIETPMMSFHSHNEHKVLSSLIERLKNGETFALISDAGTPGISDPGYLLAHACAEEEIPYETLPGATAFVPALVNSGLPKDRFIFEGFLPQKKGRQTRLHLLAEESRTIVLYESPHRLVKTLKQLAEILGPERQASVSRELSKLHEENKRGTLSELIEHFATGKVKGEIVIVLAGASK